MCAEPVAMVTKDTMRRWVVRAKPGTITETTDRESMARALGEQYGLEGHKVSERDVCEQIRKCLVSR